MRGLMRNKSTFFYSIYMDKEPLKDEYGNETGEHRIIYSEPIEMSANVSSAKGTSQIEQFGNSLQYDKVIVIDDITYPIDESSVLFVDVTPESDCEGNPLFDYIVKKVARSLNSVSLAVSRVDVS